MLKKIFRDRGLRYWLPAYFIQAAASVFQKRGQGRATQHIIFLICDHYEPKHKTTKSNQDVERVRTWVKEYPEFAERCKKEFGHYPRHSWFYPPHHGLEHLQGLNELVFKGYGELELHYHHDNDTSETFTNDIKETIKNYNQLGILLGSAEQLRPCFSFIHGDWALDNSAHGKYCGVNDELTILQNEGCWGDFTMPSAEECQTRKINSIYYAIDDPYRPKSHDKGIDARVGIKNPRGLFMMQGPLGINWGAPKTPKIENASLTSSNWGRKDRVKYWINCGIHVKGKPEWTFVKLHTHGAVEKDHDALIGERAFKMHQYLNQNYNDGSKYKLHYVTAREAFNICKAAEDGCDGDPDDYFDYVIKPYANNYYRTSRPHVLKQCSDSNIEIEYLEKGLDNRIDVKNILVKSIKGRINHLNIDRSLLSICIKTENDEQIEIDVADGYSLESASVGFFEKNGNTFVVKISGGDVTLNFSKLN